MFGEQTIVLFVVPRHFQTRVLKRLQHRKTFVVVHVSNISRKRLHEIVTEHCLVAFECRPCRRDYCAPCSRQSLHKVAAGTRRVNEGNLLSREQIQQRFKVQRSHVGPGQRDTRFLSLVAPMPNQKNQDLVVGPHPCGKASNGAFDVLLGRPSVDPLGIAFNTLREVRDVGFRYAEPIRGSIKYRGRPVVEPGAV